MYMPMAGQQSPTLVTPSLSAMNKVDGKPFGSKLWTDTGDIYQEERLLPETGVL